MILEIAEKESCVIIGRNADFILKDKDNVLNVFIHGDMPEKVARICKLYNVTEEEAEKMMADIDKRRMTNYRFYTDQKWGWQRIRHSIPVDVELKKAIPPEFLYHGTGEKYVASIDKTGLIPKSRLYVHLSGDEDTAVKVGSRHGKPVIYKFRLRRLKIIDAQLDRNKALGAADCIAYDEKEHLENLISFVSRNKKE